MRYIKHKGLSSLDEFVTVLRDEGIPSMDRIELLRRIAQVDAGERAPATFGEPDPSVPTFQVWRSVMFETPQGTRGIWLAYDAGEAGGVTVLLASARFIGAPRESTLALAQASDRQVNGTRL